MHDVLIGQQISVGRDNDARAATGGYDAVLTVLTDVDADDRRTYEVDGADDRARVGIEGCVIVARVWSERRRTFAWRQLFGRGGNRSDIPRRGAFAIHLRALTIDPRTWEQATKIQAIAVSAAALCGPLSLRM